MSSFKFLIWALSILFFSVSGQITNPCTPSIITSFSPCMDIVTNRNYNYIPTPPADCCKSLNSSMTNGKDCLCQILNGSVPFRIPINRSLAISLPRSCNMTLQCKGPVGNGPSFFPNLAPSPSPSVQELVPPEPLSPGADATPSPPAATTNVGPTTRNTGSSAGVIPSAAKPAYNFSYLEQLMAVIGVIAFSYY